MEYTDGLPENYLVYLRQCVEAREEFKMMEQRKKDFIKKRFAEEVEQADKVAYATDGK
jgi:hypothetical protein